MWGLSNPLGAPLNLGGSLRLYTALALRCFQIADLGRWMAPRLRPLSTDFLGPITQQALVRWQWGHWGPHLILKKERAYYTHSHRGAICTVSLSTINFFYQSKHCYTEFSGTLRVPLVAYSLLSSLLLPTWLDPTWLYWTPPYTMHAGTFLFLFPTTLNCTGQLWPLTHDEESSHTVQNRLTLPAWSDS